MAGIGSAGLALLGLSHTATSPSTPTTPTVTAPNSNVYLSFYGVDLAGGGNVQKFQAMVGDNAPTVTGGYAKWNVVDRPLMRSVTIFAGYEPAQMKVEVRFGQWNPGWETGPNASQKTENDIAALDMMAGSVGHYNAGPPQIVYVAAYSNQTGMSDLIPPKYQFTPYSGSKLFPWVVNGLQWGTSYRNPSTGQRVYQEATVTLLQYLGTIGSPKAPAAPTQKSGGWFIAKAGRDTALLIAGAPSSMSPNEDHKILAQRMVNANGPYPNAKNPTLGLRSINQKIKLNKPVWVPSHVQY